MNTGIIASRYARALLLLTEESGRGEQVASQIRSMLCDPRQPAELEDDIRSLVSLLERNGRLEYLRFVFRSFLDQYYRSAGILEAQLITAVEAPGLVEKLCALIEERTGRKVLIDTKVDPDIIGGFIFEVDSRMCDASVRTAIERIRREFIQQNTRLV